MTLNEYQEKAMGTCLPSSNNFSYMMLNLVGEVGEFASKVAKAIRKQELRVSNHLRLGDHYDDFEYEHTMKFYEIMKAAEEAEAEADSEAVVDCNRKLLELHDQHKKDKLRLVEELTAEMKKEAGDILWQLSGLCEVMGWKLEDVAQMNLDKLASRKERNKIDGDGDNR